jgi:hypothetical protein
METACLFKIKGSKLFKFFSITKCGVIISAEQCRAEQSRAGSAIIITPCTCNYVLSVACAADQGRCAVPVLWLGKSSRQKGGDIENLKQRISSLLLSTGYK